MKSRKIKIDAIEGFRVGNAEDIVKGTGCTAIICEKGAVGGVDVRGGAPATRDTDLLRSENTVECVHAVVMSGGSAFGLEASSGVMRKLQELGVGFQFRGQTIPIVCGASLYDLEVGDPEAFPDVEMGKEAVNNAFNGIFDTGNKGAGTGACVGKYYGTGRAMKTGLGTFACGDGYVQLGAVVAVNALGDVYNGAGNIIAGLRTEDGRSIYGTIKALKSQVHEFSDIDMEEMHPVTDRSTYSTSKMERTRSLEEIKNAIKHAFEKNNPPTENDLSRNTREIEKIADIPAISDIQEADTPDLNEIEDIYLSMAEPEAMIETQPETEAIEGFETEAESIEEPETEMEPIAEAEPEPEAIVETETEPISEPESEAFAESYPESEPIPEPATEPEPEPINETESIDEMNEEEPHGPNLEPEDLGYDITFNTTIGCLITNAKLTKTQCNKLASILNDAYARAIKPVHSTQDGDTIFVLSSGNQDVNFDAFAALATDVMQYAIIDAANSSRSAYGLPAASDIK